MNSRPLMVVFLFLKEIVALEALLRWQHPKFGQISPAYFIPIAEGVEEKSEIDILKKLNCDYVQGFYYYKPMPIAELESIICLDCNIQLV